MSANMILILTGVIAFIVGALFMMSVIMAKARNNFVVELESKYSFDETVERLKKVINEADGWVLPIPEWYFSQGMQKMGFPFEGIKRLDVYFICKAKYAQPMISGRPAFSAMTPCGWSVYEKDNGKVYLGSLNVGLLAMPFKGFEKEVFQNVAKEIAKMQDKIVK